MLLGTSAVLTGAALAVLALLRQQTGLPTQSQLGVVLLYAGFAVTVLGFLYGVVVDARSGSDDE